jgi:hypothetical protein
MLLSHEGIWRFAIGANDANLVVARQRKEQDCVMRAILLCLLLYVV